MASGDVDGLRPLQDALARGDMAVVARALATLEPEARIALEARLGTEPLREVFRQARRAPRAAKRGTVIVLNGIMGAQLDVGSAGEERRVWANLLRLMRGDFQRLKLARDGAPFDPAYSVRVAGIFPDYLPLLMSLQERWTVVPFAFDWRQDIARSAEALELLIRTRSLPRPVHLVAHSMGGLVARTYVRRFPESWRSLSQPAGERRVGRLIMLGTPNRGSLAIPLVLTGKERMVQLLKWADLANGERKTLDVVGSFPGCYQMLPAPDSFAGDDRALLYEPDTWNAGYIHAEHLALGAAFHRTMAEVIDAERMVYVAGYDQETPFRIRVVGARRFEYQTTREGDGRVPHELGLLPGVATFYVREAHGDLPQNPQVRDSIGELLEKGETRGLLASPPRQRVARGAEGEGEWRTAEEVEPITERDREIRDRYRARRGEPRAAGHAPADEAQQIVDEGVEMRGWTGVPAEERVAEVRRRRGGGGAPRAMGADAGLPAEVAGNGARAPVAPGGKGRARGVARSGRGAVRPLLSVQMVWGDITLDEAGDVYVAGHYENVVPQAAEAALDVMVSAEDAQGGDRAEARLVHSLTKRGAIRGSLGDVYFFPWAEWALRHERRRGWSRKRRLVAIAGMGYSGTFAANELRRLTRHLVFALQRLPGVDTLCTVLVGAGNGNLRVRAAVDAYVRGLLDGLGERDAGGRPMTLRIVEARLGKAIQIERELKRLGRELASNGGTSFAVLERAVTPRTMSFDASDAYALALAGASWRSAQPASDRERRRDSIGGAIREVLDAARGAPSDFEQVTQRLTDLWERVLEERRVAAGGAEEDRDLLARTPVLRALEALGTLDVGFRSETTSASDATTRLGVVRERSGSDLELPRPARDGGDGAAPPPAIVAPRITTTVSALTSTAVIPKRPSNVDWGLVGEAITRLTDPSPELINRYGADLAAYLLPRDFRELLTRVEPIVFEVDRTTATVPWEMICNPSDSDGEATPLALARHVTRQLRTEYSPPPSLAPVRGRRLRILVVGDPGSPADEGDLPGARNEALAVVALLEGLRERGVDLEVKAMIGAPSVKDDARLARFPRASRFDVLSELRLGTYDVLHFCGHGDFDPEMPTRAGWVFEGGLLTSYELERLDVAPPLVVANACMSGILSQRTGGGTVETAGARDRDLVPGLADEFFRRGVHTYIGTAWYVNDVGATVFARAFYEALLDPTTVQAQGKENAECVDGTIGGAMHYARRVLKTYELEFDALWAAYHHYGDPTQRVSVQMVDAPAGAPPRAGTPAKARETTNGGRARQGAKPRASAERTKGAKRAAKGKGTKQARPRKQAKRAGRPAAR